jgi:hypothetical protein
MIRYLRLVFLGVLALSLIDGCHGEPRPVVQVRLLPDDLAALTGLWPGRWNCRCSW